MSEQSQQSPGKETVEDVKRSSRHLRGTLAEELVSGSAGFSADAAQLLKFHGVYPQDNRDVRRERTQAKLPLDHICMVRASVPGGVLTAEQYLALDEVAGAVGNGTLRVTTRQGIQFHFAKKQDLATLVGTLNRNLVTTHAACGDVVRNVTCCPAPQGGALREDLVVSARSLAARLKPKSGAYYELWVDGDKVAAPTARGQRAAVPESEPLYGDAYLPRKFKIGFAAPGDNCIDVYSHDLGLIPRVDGAELVGYTVVVGCGMGAAHADPTTHPSMAVPLADIDPAELAEVAEAVIGTQRDHGNREDRQHARLKYLVEDWGIERFGAEVERRLGRDLRPASPVAWDGADDHLGWHPQDPSGDPSGRWWLGVFVENGRIGDFGDRHQRSALRQIVRRFSPGVRLTSRQDVLLTDLAGEDRAEVEAVLADHGVPLAEQLSPVARNAMACPALPTCGLALGESERVLPAFIAELEAELSGLGLGDQPIHVNMTGCPNGFARPYTAEVGIVGRTKTAYDLHLGGAREGTRLAPVLTTSVKRDALVATLRPLLVAYRDDRVPGEGFGDWCHRAGIERLRELAGVEATQRSAA